MSNMTAVPRRPPRRDRGRPRPVRNLRTVRLARGLTQADLAQRAGLQQVYISALERGLLPSQESHVTRLAEALEVDQRALVSDAVIVTADGSVDAA